MPNLYGVANAAASFIVPGWPVADVACNPNVATSFYTSPTLIAPSQGWFHAVAWGCAIVLSGASVPQNSSFYISIGAGSTTSQYAVASFAYQANISVPIPVCMATPASQTAWVSPGSTISLWFNPATNAATVRQISSFTIALIRAPDQ